MSIIPITGDNIQIFKTVARPKRVFSTSSSGITGSFRLDSDYSKSLKDIDLKITQGIFNEDSLETSRCQLINSLAFQNSGLLNSSYAAAKRYLEAVNSSKHSIKQTKRQEVRRFIPGTRLEDNFFHKFSIKNTLFSHYRTHYPTAHWAYTNYHCLNFFSGDSVPSDSVLIYPAGTGSTDFQDVNYLAPSSSFTFDFWLKPKGATIPYSPGTILHMSSCYAISLVSGSGLSPDGQPSNYRLMLQLSSSADIPPSDILIADNNTVSTSLNISTDHIFVTPINSLKRDWWHHVSIRWSGRDRLGGYGNITIDGLINKEFSINEKQIMQSTSSHPSILDPDALFIGNYYEGTNAGASCIAKFFAPDTSANEGLLNFNSSITNGDPLRYSFNHPLNAELHDIKIYDHYRFNEQVLTQSATGSILEKGLLFYLPPFFVKESRTRNVLQTPFQKIVGSTEAPFNVPMSFGVAGLDINLENFTRDFVRKEYPRLLHLSSSYIATQVDQEGLTATDILYSSGSQRKRNLTILPCDNGKFLPNFELLASGTTRLSPLEDSPESLFTNDLGYRDLRLISLNNMLRDEARIFSLSDAGNGTMAAAIAASTPESPADDSEINSPIGYYLDSSNILTVFQRTGDDSSNEVVFFDMSNLFYGDRIYPGTFKITDTSLSGSAGSVSITLKDDGKGNIYRADALSKHSTWSSVGNIFYDDGIVVIKSPHLVYFGKDGYTMEFEGERNIHTMEYSIPAPAGLINSSSNPAYRKLTPTDFDSETDSEFVYLTGVQLHDNNLNVIMRANLAQPIIKRDGDKILVKIRIDF